ncbi:MAG: HlyD family secretion protein [Confluentimicrobium sp.]|jgi:multidrug resistance efflux pump|uniref:HlyD family secretion protein n=1 Tax=Actibacterium sp. TaxID=1872125 RepID=UPI0009DFDE73|nr:HlyD family secretion protein [Actibacterium sp.]MBC57122.1 HlyD family secretion protein [Actibacterium sp.]|tara:strand:+ start:771 stop:1919 length:1149 start_codon:yes stop_codon:yes gene_type:complete
MTNTPDTETTPSPGTPASETVADEAKAGNPAKKIGLLVLLILAGIVGWYVASDRYAPGTNRGIVMANVTQVAPRVSGRVMRVEVDDNAFVAADAPLFHIDARPFQLVVEQAKAQLQQAHQSLDASSAQLVASQANVAQARASLENARAANDRTLALSRRGLVPKAQVDNARAALENAQATLDAALAQLDSAKRQLGVTGDDNPQIRAAQLRLEQANYDLLSTTVRAPRPGVVTNLKLSVGQFMGAGSPAMTFIESEGFWINADLRENQLVNVDPGDTVEILFDALPGRIFQGRVDSVAWGINPGQTEAGGLPVNKPATQWFEPARRIPVRINLDTEGTGMWPQKARLGGKVSVLIHAQSPGHPISLLAAFFLRLQGFATALY